MMPTVVSEQAPVPPPAYHRAQARVSPALHIDALTLVRTLHLLTFCHLAVQLAHRRCPPPLPAGPGGAPRTYRQESLLLLALLRTLWRLSYQDLHDWLVAWPALALACGLPLGHDGRPRIPSPSQQCKRGQAAGAPGPEALFILSVLSALPQPSMRVRSYAAIACIPCSVAAPACPFSTCSLPPTSMMLLLLVPSWNGRCASTPSARASSAWMPPIGACASSLGSTPPFMPSLSSPGTPSARKTARACRPLGPKRNSANAVRSNASLAASSSFFIYNVRLSGAGRPSHGRSP